VEKAREYEARLDVEGLIQRSLEGIKVTKIDAQYDEHQAEKVWNIDGELVAETFEEEDFSDLL